MDEFHSFADPERGIVWELSLALLPPHVRLLLLSATVGNAAEFLNWLDRCHGRKLELVEGTRAQGAADLPAGCRTSSSTSMLVDMAKGDDADAQDAGPGLLLQPRRVLERRRAAQGPRPAAGRRQQTAAATPRSTSSTGRRASGRS